MNPLALRRLAPGLLLLAGVLLLFRDTAAAMVGIWIRSETFTHAFLVPPIVVWMIWRRRATLARLQPRAAPWMLLPMAAMCLLWLLGELIGSNAATQFALVALLVLSVPAVFGLQVAHALLFPLLFLFFAVPVGEFMVPSMMEWTADFTVAALRLTGVPVYREGLQFVIPTGNWSVVEACSGVRYLIASFMVGTLFAYINFQSYRRRAVFMVASLLVPIAANWVRAYLIVMLGHLSGNKLAAGVDHLIYGWVFFGLVIGVMFLVGARWAEPDPALPELPAVAARAAASAATPRLTAQAWGIGAGALALLLTTQAAYWQLERVLTGEAPVLQLPARLAQGWDQADGLTSDWTPAYANPSVVAAGSYRDPGTGATVAVWLGYYRGQGYERKLVSSSNGLVAISEHANWAQTEGGRAALSLPAQGDVVFHTASLRGAGAPGAQGAQRLRAWRVYWIGGDFVSGDFQARLRIALNRLRGRGDDSAVVILHTPLPDASDVAAADGTLRRFATAQLGALAAVLNSAR